MPFVLPDLNINKNICLFNVLRRVVLTDDLGEGKTLDNLCLLHRHSCVSDETEASKLRWKGAAIL